MIRDGVATFHELSREAQACLAETDLGLRLPRQVQLASRLEACCAESERDSLRPEDVDPKKIRLLKDHLRVMPPRVDAVTPEALRVLAGRMEGQYWTGELLAMLESEFDRLQKEASDATSRVRKSRAETQQLEGAVQVFQSYVSLLDTLTDHGVQEETR